MKRTLLLAAASWLALAGSSAHGQDAKKQPADTAPSGRLHGRIIDLSYAAAHRIGIAQNGSGEVEVQSILPGTLAQSPQASRPPLAEVATAPAITTPLAAARCPASPTSPSEMSSIAEAPAVASASPAPIRATGDMNRSRYRSGGTLPRSRWASATAGPPSAPVSTTRSPGRAPRRDTTRVASPSTVQVGEPFSVTVTASAPFGVDFISWHIENVPAGERERQLGGQVVESATFDAVTLDRAGTFVLEADARDRHYATPLPGYPHTAGLAGRRTTAVLTVIERNEHESR